LGLVRTWKESKLARGTYLLERAEVESGQEMERKLRRATYFLERLGWD